MCGFVVVYHPKRINGYPYAQVKEMCDAIAHRGPDHFGFSEKPEVVMGHRRLSIIDLSNHAHQPMEDDDSLIAFNGEIYNYLELRSELINKHGIKFHSNSDTEVILKAYCQWGEACLNRFNGMFAFVLWDKENKQLFVARDRFGVKPLFWTRGQSGEWIFASDIRSIWSVKNPADQIDKNSITNCLVNGFYVGNGTASTDIKRFPESHFLKLDHSGGIAWQEYWRVSTSSKVVLSFNDAVDETETLLRDAVKLRMRSDVPVGSFLSGGIDSSLVTVEMAQTAANRMHTFSIGVDSAEFDESAYAKIVANQYDTIHHHISLNSDGLDELPRIVNKFSDVFGDSSALPSYFVSKEAAKEIKVVFSGDGADESFGGYVIPYATYLNQYYKNIPESLRRLMLRTLKTSNASHLHGALRWFTRFNELSLNRIEDLYKDFSLKSVWGSYSDYFIPPYDDSDLADSLAKARAETDYDKVMYAEIYDRLTNDYLVKLDLSSMAHSIEGRSPFMDYRLMQLGYQIPGQVKYKGWKRKAVLKKLAEKHFDKNFVYRKKMGFSIPLAQWMSSDRYYSIIRTILSRESLLDEILPRNIIDSVMDEFSKNPKLHASRVWSILWFQIWEGLFISKCYAPDARLSDLTKY